MGCEVSCEFNENDKCVYSLRKLEHEGCPGDDVCPYIVDRVFLTGEPEAILKAASQTVISSPMTASDIIRVIDLIGDVYSLGMDIEDLFEKAGMMFHERKSPVKRGDSRPENHQKLVWP